MTACLKDESLYRLYEGQGTPEQQYHLESCMACDERYKRMTRDLDLIRYALRQESPLQDIQANRMPFIYDWIPAAAALVAAVLMLWGGSWIWRTRPPAISELTSSSELSQFLNEVSEAVFTHNNVRRTTVASNSDFVLLHVALGESCSEACQKFYYDATNKSLSSFPDEGITGNEGKNQRRRE